MPISAAFAPAGVNAGRTTCDAVGAVTSPAHAANNAAASASAEVMGIRLRAIFGSRI
jgi:hypothetical protein